MNVNPVQVLDLGSLRPNPENPKRPLGARYRRGLQTALAEYGFAGVFVVARNADGTYTTLDGTSRLDLLDREGVERVPCVVLEDCAEGMPDWQDRRREFVLAYDRHKKIFDEDAVLGQLQALAERGRDHARLAALAGKENLQRLLASRQAAPAPEAPKAAAPAMASLVLYGPAEDVGAIRDLLKGIKGRSLAGKARAALGQAAEFLDWSDERVAAVLLATVARFAAEGGA